jgi:hypothetical protein
MTGLLYQQQKTGGPHISLVFREMSDTTVLDRQLCRFVSGSVPGFPASLLSPATTDVVLSKENHTQLTEAANLDRKSGEGEGSAVRHSCVPTLPAHNLRQSSSNPHGNTNAPLSFRVCRRGPRNPGSLGFAPPDFLLRLVALANFMRLSSREKRTRNRVQRSVAGNPGRDDKKERIVASKGRLMNRGIFQI